MILNNICDIQFSKGNAGKEKASSEPYAVRLFKQQDGIGIVQEVGRQRTGRAVRGRPGARRSVFVRHPAAARAPAAQLPPSHAPRDKGSLQTQSSDLKLPNACPHSQTARISNQLI